MTNIADLTPGGEPGADPAPDNIHDGVYTACDYPTPGDVMGIGDNVESDADEHAGTLHAGFALGHVPD